MSPRRHTTTAVLLTAIAVTLGPATASADERFSLALRHNVVTAGGEPANDIPSLGLAARYRLGTSPWLLGVAVDVGEYDFERPAAVLGLEQDRSVAVIDSVAEAVWLWAWIEREHRLGDSGRYLGFWSLGGGYASPDVADVSGPLASGGRFDITTSADSELLLSGALGLRRRLGARWAFEAALRLDHHFADWQVRDRVSGRSASIDDYTGYGLHLALSYRF